MIRRFESLPNEIFLIIFSNLSWSELLISFWSLNKRFNILICSILSRIDNQFNSGIVINEPGLSISQYYSILFPLIFDSSSSSSVACCIRRIHFDGTNSSACDLINELLFNNDTKILRFPNLKLLVLTRCLLMKPLIENLPFLIKHQLDELMLTLDEDIIELAQQRKQPSRNRFCEKKLMTTFKELIRQLFSSECRLTLLRLDIICKDSYLDLHQSLTSGNNISSNSIHVKYQTCCMTLRRLYIHIEYTCFLEQLIEHVPLIEQLFVKFRHSLDTTRRSESDIEILMKTNGNWFDKVPNLQCFTLKTYVDNDFEFAYLKWILNNVNHVEKLKIHLINSSLYGTDNVIWNSVIDANFIRQYCMPDRVINLTHFNFRIISKCKLPINNIEKIIQSFKIHPFFIDHQWTNVKCFFDPIESDQYLSSSMIYKPRFFNNYIYFNKFLNWPYIRHVSIYLHSCLYLYLEQFDQLFPNAFCIKVNMTSSNDSIDENITRARLLANFISMPIQLKYLRINKFKWLLDMVQYASDELRKNALNTVRYAEFNVPSCHRASIKSIHIGKNLVPFLSTYMPNIQTLRLWRLDDFPWTSSMYTLNRKTIHNELSCPVEGERKSKCFQKDLIVL
ncbi:unnamed protein product [Rotaria sp. Silwood2]|nr:unnamed protein product [Rotaria sp. Silwood2]